MCCFFQYIRCNGRRTLKLGPVRLWGVRPMFPGTYVPRYLCSPVPMFPNTYVPRYGVRGRVSCNIMQLCNFAYICFLVTCAEPQINLYMHIDGCSCECTAGKYHTLAADCIFILVTKVYPRTLTLLLASLSIDHIRSRDRSH